MKRKLLYLGMGVALCYFACKKYDHQFPVSDSQNVAKFFKTNSETPQIVKRVADAVEKNNSRFHYLNTLIKDEGFANWNKSTIVINGSDTTVTIPMVQEGKQYVTSFIIAKIAKDVRVKIISGRAYGAYGFSNGHDTLNAKIIADKLMYFDYKIFGDTLFKVTDPDIYNVKAGDTGNYAIRIIKQDKRTQATIIGYTYECYNIVHDGDHGQLTGVPPGGSGDYYYTTDTYCEYTPVFVDMPAPGDPYYTGGVIYYTKPNSNCRDAYGNPCGITVYPNTPPPVIPSIPTEPTTPERKKTPCDSITNLANDTSFMYYMKKLKSLENNKTEYGYAIYQANDKVGYADVDGKFGEAAINVTRLLNIGVKLKGFMHLHYKEDSLFSIYSGGDLFTLYQIYKQNLMENPATFIFPLVTGKNTNYILRVAQPEILLAFGDIWLKDEASLEVFEYMNYRYITKKNSAKKNEAAFLKVASLLGLEVYRGNETFTSFERIKLNAFDKVVTDPCK